MSIVIIVKVPKRTNPNPMIPDASWLSLTKVFQFIISDAGPEGKFVLDLKNGSGAAKAGEEAGAVSS